MNNHSAKFTFTGKLQFFIRQGEAIWNEEKRYYHIDLSVAEKMKYGSIVSCSCVVKGKTLSLQFASSGNLPAGIIKGFISPDGNINGKYELPDKSFYTVVSANFLSDSNGYSVSGSWTSECNSFYLEAALEVDD